VKRNDFNCHSTLSDVHATGSKVVDLLVAVDLVDLYSASRSVSNALLAPIAPQKDEFSAPI